ASGQTSLFGLLDAPAAREASTMGATYPRAEPWDSRELLARERSSLGFYITGHPLDRFANELARFTTATTATLGNLSDLQKVTVAGIVEDYRERPTKTGQRIAFFQLEDRTGRVEVVVRSRELDAARGALTVGEPVIVEGVVQHDRNGGGGGDDDDVLMQPEVRIALDDVRPLAEALTNRTRVVAVKLAADRIEPDKLRALRDVLDRFPGNVPVAVEIVHTKRWRVTVATRGLKVHPTSDLVSQCDRIFGSSVVELR
ncbi:MAG: hypothetical protein IT379_12885, partial [Deltaproteobacteria bacterium]|nr:hypothetical protein [Deltaproteobacteria bacterium]